VILAESLIYTFVFADIYEMKGWRKIRNEQFFAGTCMLTIRIPRQPLP